MTNNKPEGKTWEVLAEKCEAIGYGTWQVELIIYNGECTGFDEIQPAKIKFRVKKT